ncbi:HAD family hydrolase [Desnuesiella massiliensis]|uniref:HAD family hydrolase n=1 Tax=Desnuesiella massiliensis TaxID=1650662 RepID=UPI0006E45DF2|nr:HAD family phosphatase [Desnuesiella massiliensis]
MIKNIVFDVGNVLVSFNPLQYLESFKLDKDVKDHIMEAIFKSKEWIELDRGTLTEDEAVQMFCLSSEEHSEAIKAIMANWMSMLTPIEESISILKELKRREYKIYILSNYHEKSFKYINENNEFFSLIDGKVVSSEIKLLKPEKEIYEELINKYSLKAEECLFIDDTLTNIEAAKEIGIKGVWFKNPNELRKELTIKKIL